MAARLTMFVTLAALALAVFHVPTVLTGRVLVSDAQVSEGWTDVVEAAERGIRSELDGLYGLRLAGLTCNGALPIAFFDVLGPFAPVPAVVASSTDPWEGSDPAWQLRFPGLSREHPDAASLIPPDATPCASVRGARGHGPGGRGSREVTGLRS